MALDFIELDEPYEVPTRYVLKKSSGERVDATFQYYSGEHGVEIETADAGKYHLEVYSGHGFKLYRVFIEEKLNDGGLSYYMSGFNSVLSEEKASEFEERLRDIDTRLRALGSVPSVD